MPSKVFRGIWYRSKPSKEQTLKDAFYGETGKLIIDSEGIRFKNKESDIQISNIHCVSFGLQGTDPINSWIKVSYNQDGEIRDAYFADGKLFGYFGFFGGTWRIFKSLDHLVDLPEINDQTHIKNKIALVFIFFVLVLMLYWKYQNVFSN